MTEASADTKKINDSSEGGSETIVKKSLVGLNICPFDAEQNLDELAHRILGLTFDGLAWRGEYRQIPIAYGIRKLQIECVIEDEKVNIDDVTEIIQSWEDEVMNVDIHSFQKI